jgi:uncharacterized protein YkwD
VRALTIAGALLATHAPAIAAAAGHHRAASTASASCPDRALIPTPANATRAEAATFCLINVQRARHALRALRPNADLARSAQRHSLDMVAANYFDHTSPSGETPLARIKASTYLTRRSAYLVGENIALATMQLATPAAIVAGWMHSPGHRANILNPDFRDSGIGIVAHAPTKYSAGQPGATYTQQFGVIATD